VTGAGFCGVGGALAKPNAATRAKNLIRGNPLSVTALRPSSPAKAGDPVFHGGSDRIEKLRRTGYSAFAEYDDFVWSGRIACKNAMGFDSSTASCGLHAHGVTLHWHVAGAGMTAQLASLCLVCGARRRVRCGVPAEFDGILGPALLVASSLKPAEPPVTVPAEPAAAPPPAPAASANVLYRAKAVASAIVVGFMRPLGLSREQ
jgi:hypothetical protein